MKGVSDDASAVQAEDVRDAHAIGFRPALHAVREGQQLPGLVQEVLAAWREGDVAAVAQQQATAEVVLQLADLLGQRRLADEQPGRCPAEVQLLGDRDEVAHQPEVEIHPVLPGRP